MCDCSPLFSLQNGTCLFEQHLLKVMKGEVPREAWHVAGIEVLNVMIGMSNERIAEVFIQNGEMPSEHQKQAVERLIHFLVLENAELSAEDVRLLPRETLLSKLQEAINKWNPNTKVKPKFGGVSYIYKMKPFKFNTSHTATFYWLGV